MARKKGALERYAIKCISSEEARKKNGLERLKNEVEVMRHVKGSEYLVQVYDCFEDGQNYYLVMEYLRNVPNAHPGLSP